MKSPKELEDNLRDMGEQILSRPSAGREMLMQAANAVKQNEERGELLRRIQNALNAAEGDDLIKTIEGMIRWQQQMERAARRLLNNLNEFGKVTDGIFMEVLQSVIDGPDNILCQKSSENNNPVLGAMATTESSGRTR